MSFEEYWIGKGIDYERIWEDYNDGKDWYLNKFKSMNTHLLQIKFQYPGPELPLINHEVLYKTIKGLYHDVKERCFSTEEYNQFGPLFLYDIQRGSGIFEFLGDPVPLLMLIILFGLPEELKPKLIKKLERYFDDIRSSKKLDNESKKLDNDIKQKKLEQMKRDSRIQTAIENFLKQKPRISMSKDSFDGDIEKTRKTLIEIDFKDSDE